MKYLRPRPLWYRSGDAVNDTAGTAPLGNSMVRRADRVGPNKAATVPGRSNLHRPGPDSGCITSAAPLQTAVGIVRHESAIHDAACALRHRHGRRTVRAADGNRTPSVRSVRGREALPAIECARCTGPDCNRRTVSREHSERSIRRGSVRSRAAVVRGVAGRRHGPRDVAAERHRASPGPREPVRCGVRRGAPRILEVVLGRSTIEHDDFRLFAARSLIVATVRFDQPVAVDTTHGVPQIELVMGTPPLRQGGYVSRYASGSGSAELRFHYVPRDRHQDVREVQIDADAIRLRGGAIHAVGRRAAASLTTRQWLNRRAMWTLGLHRQSYAPRCPHRNRGSCRTSMAETGLWAADSGPPRRPTCIANGQPRRLPP